MVERAKIGAIEEAPLRGLSAQPRASAASFGANESRALENIGAGVQRSAAGFRQDALQEMKKENDRFLKTQVRDKLNEFQTASREYEDQIFSLKGKEASEIMPGANKWYQDAKRRYGAGIVDPDAKALFDANFDVMAGSRLNRMSTHQRNQRNVFAKESLAAENYLATQEAVANRNDFGSVNALAGLIEGNVRETFSGEDPDIVDVEVAKAINNLHVQVIDAYRREGRVTKAQEYIKEFRDDMAPSMVPKLERLLEDDAKTNEAAKRKEEAVARAAVKEQREMRKREGQEQFLRQLGRDATALTPKQVVQMGLTYGWTPAETRANVSFLESFTTKEEETATEAEDLDTFANLLFRSYDVQPSDNKLLADIDKALRAEQISKSDAQRYVSNIVAGGNKVAKGVVKTLTKLFDDKNLYFAQFDDEAAEWFDIDWIDDDFVAGKPLEFGKGSTNDSEWENRKITDKRVVEALTFMVEDYVKRNPKATEIEVQQYVTDHILVPAKTKIAEKMARAGILERIGMLKRRQAETRLAERVGLQGDNQ